MSYLYLDDGHPDSVEYENNYIPFNGDNVNVMTFLTKYLKGKDTSNPAIREHIHQICEASYLDQECLKHS